MMFSVSLLLYILVGVLSTLTIVVLIYISRIIQHVKDVTFKVENKQCELPAFNPLQTYLVNIEQSITRDLNTLASNEVSRAVEDNVLIPMIGTDTPLVIEKVSISGQMILFLVLQSNIVSLTLKKDIQDKKINRLMMGQIMYIIPEFDFDDLATHLKSHLQGVRQSQGRLDSLINNPNSYIIFALAPYNRALIPDNLKQEDYKLTATLFGDVNVDIETSVVLESFMPSGKTVVLGYNTNSKQRV